MSPGETADSTAGKFDPLSAANFTSKHDLKRKSVRSASVTLATQLCGIFVQTVSTVVLARLLTPGDYGVMAMVLALTAFARLFQDLGLSSATVQAASLSQAQASTLFWINAGLGVLLTLAVIALAPVLVWFYQTESVFWPTIVSSANFLAASLAVQHSALLKRQMRFTALGTIQIASSLGGAAAAIVAAVAGLGLWALVIGPLATSLISTLLFWVKSEWRPGRWTGAAGSGGLIKFGAHVTGFEIANYFSRNADNILIGRVWGPEILGLYSRAYSLLMLPITTLRGPLNAVAFPALSAMRSRPDQYCRYYRRYLSLLAFLSMPLSALLLVTSESLVRTVLGDQWVGASGIFTVLAISAFIQPVASTRGLILMSTGKGARYFRWGIWNALFVVTGFALGLRWGGLGVATAYAVVNYLILYPSLIFTFRDTPVRVLDFFQCIARATVASAIAAGAAFVLRPLVVDSGSLPTLLSCGALFAVVYVAVFYALPGGPAELKEYLSYRSLLGGLRTGNSTSAAAGK